MDWYPALYGLFGLVVGSFLNVCIHRLPRRESIVWPRSHCPRCGKPIAAYDNIPVLSFLLLGGKCRSCRSPISLRYPLVELLTALLFCACAVKWGFSSPSFVNLLFLAVIIVLMFIDYQHQILPNVLTLPGTLAGVLFCSWQDLRFYSDSATFGLAAILSPGDELRLLPWAGSLLGALVGSGVLLVVGLLYQLARKRQGLGMGDVKMMAMVGAFLGWRLVFLTILLGSALGSIVGIFLMLFRDKSLQTKLAFGTFLGAAAAIALFYGLGFLDWYASSPAARQ